MESLLTVIGNLIIIKSFVSNPKLRTMNNLYIINLAIADIIIGLVSMNFFTVYLVSNSWIFGPTICDAWLTIDYVASNTSVLTLVIICFDRYCSGRLSRIKLICWAISYWVQDEDGLEQRPSHLSPSHPSPLKAWKVNYTTEYKNKRIYTQLFIISSWLVSTALWTPGILGWQYYIGNRTVPDSECYVQDSFNHFWWPLTSFDLNWPSWFDLKRSHKEFI